MYVIFAPNVVTLNTDKTEADWVSPIYPVSNIFCGDLKNGNTCISVLFASYTHPFRSPQAGYVVK